MLKYLLIVVRGLGAAQDKISHIGGKYGPKFFAVGTLLIVVGTAFQGRFDEISHTDIELALVALGLMGARPKYVSSQDVGIRK